MSIKSMVDVDIDLNVGADVNVERKNDVHVHVNACVHDDVLGDAKEYLLSTLDGSTISLRVEHCNSESTVRQVSLHRCKPQ